MINCFSLFCSLWFRKGGLTLTLTLIGLNHQVVDVVLEIVDSPRHVVDPGDYLVRHGLKSILHLLEHVLNICSQFLHVLRLLGNGPASSSDG